MDGLVAFDEGCCLKCQFVVLVLQFGKKVQKEKEEVEKTKMDKQLEIVYQDLEEKIKQILGTKVSINAKDENIFPPLRIHYR